MPEHCAAYLCSSRRTVENRARGITFHKFPKDKDVRKKWEVALKREGFIASDSSVLCSKHFKQGDFDRTGQIVRLRDGVLPSIFSFPVHHQRLKKGRTTSTSRRAEESLPMASRDDPETGTSHSQPQPKDDHGSAMPASPTALKTRLNEALARVESLEREKKNAMAREKRAKTGAGSGKELEKEVKEERHCPLPVVSTSFSFMESTVHQEVGVAPKCERDPTESEINSTEAVTTNLSDEDELFLLSLLPSMKRLTIKKRMEVRMKFQQVLYAAEFKD